MYKIPKQPLVAGNNIELNMVVKSKQWWSKLGIIHRYGRKPKIIPHISGTLEQIADAFFVKDRAYTQAEQKQKKNKNAQGTNS